MSSIKKVGLVLAGGGARGGYEIGALKALEELGFKYDVITGTSVGAINAFMILSNKKDVLFQMWDTIDYEAVVDHKYKWKNKSLETILKAPFHNGFALTPLEKLINDNIDEEAIRNNPIKGGLVFTERFFKYRSAKVEEMEEGSISNYIFTSSAAHPFLKRKVVRGKKCRDGWFSDNVPVNLALELGAEKIFAIDIMWGINRKVAKDVDIYYLRPSKKMKFFLNFSNDVVREAIEMGYTDVMNKKEEILNFLNN